MAVNRQVVIDRLVERDRVWPLIDSSSCRMCAVPRKEEHHKGFATCYDCGQLSKRYGRALHELFPITYTTRDWAVGASMRRFKDQIGCRTDSSVAVGFGAVLSAYLEKQLERIAPRAGFDLVVPVPSSNPTVANSLERARQEGWWAPDLEMQVARVRRGFPRQRARKPQRRHAMDGKWEIIDRDSIVGSDVLILDDIYTTGNSLHSFARELRDAGARSTRAVVLARNVGVGDGAWIRPLLQVAVAEGRPWTPGVNKRDVIR